MSGFYECFHCGQRAVSWDADFDFSDYGFEGEGIVQNCHCNNCGAEIIYIIPCGEEREENEDDAISSVLAEIRC